MRYTLDSSELTRRVTIQSRPTGRGILGDQSTAWTDLVKCWAGIEQLQGRELSLAQAINSEVTHKVTMRYRAGITAAQRVVYQGRVFNVLDVLDPETAHVALELMCSEGLNEG